MLIGVLSDTHDRMDTLRGALRQFEMAGVETVIHAGDYVAPFVAKAFKDRPFRLLGVFGNNDGEKLGLNQWFEDAGATVVEGWGTWELAGKRILVMHEPRGIDALVSQGAHDLIIYGHTHKMDLQTGKTLVLNPGEACGWVEGNGSAAVVDLTTLQVDFIDLGH